MFFVGQHILCFSFLLMSFALFRVSVLEYIFHVSLFFGHVGDDRISASVFLSKRFKHTLPFCVVI